MRGILKVEAFGPRTSRDEAERRRVSQERLRELGDVSYGRIVVAPFAVERAGTTFGLAMREPDEDEEDVWAVEVRPGNSTVKAGDLIEPVPGLTLIVDVETAGNLGEAGNETEERRP